MSVVTLFWSHPRREAQAGRNRHALTFPRLRIQARMSRPVGCDTGGVRCREEWEEIGVSSSGSGGSQVRRGGGGAGCPLTAATGGSLRGRWSHPRGAARGFEVGGTAAGSLRGRFGCALQVFSFRPIAGLRLPSPASPCGTTQHVSVVSPPLSRSRAPATRGRRRCVAALVYESARASRVPSSHSPCDPGTAQPPRLSASIRQVPWRRRRGAAW